MENEILNINSFLRKYVEKVGECEHKNYSENMQKLMGNFKRVFYTGGFT